MNRFCMTVWLVPFGEKVDGIGNPKVTAVTAASEKEARLRVIEHANHYRLRVTKIVTDRVRVLE